MLGKATRCVTVLTLIIFLPFSATTQVEKTIARRFRMGFTGFPHGYSIEAVTHAREFCWIRTGRYALPTQCGSGTSVSVLPGKWKYGAEGQ